MKASLVVVPTPETIGRLRQVFDMAPFSPVYDKMLLEIASSSSTPSWNADSTRVYSDVKVRRVDAQSRFLDDIATRILVADCSSPSLSARAAELGASFDKFPWVITTDLQVSRTVRVFLASLNNTLVLHEGPFSFTGEIVLEKE